MSPGPVTQILSAYPFGVPSSTWTWPVRWRPSGAVHVALTHDWVPVPLREGAICTVTAVTSCRVAIAVARVCAGRTHASRPPRRAR